EWHNIVAWGNLANDIAEKRRNYIKGDLLFVEGKIKTRQYTDGQGAVKYITEIVAERMNLISSRNPSTGTYVNETSSENSSDNAPKPSVNETYPESTDATGDDLPF
ncbi:MAG: single-stranded DNA-binding protein, partial [Ignavibacteria bacterium]|nr:single-stranded DNA-binding protein [Ignavibacteria bacterium]